MNKGNQLKMVVCGVALVSLSSIRPASAQITSGPCFSESTEGPPEVCVEFDPGPNTHRVDFPGNHSLKVILTARKKFFLDITAVPVSPPGPTARYPDPENEVCIPYAFATSDTILGTCTRYEVAAFDGVTGFPIPQADEHLYFRGRIIYRIAWDHPTLNTAFFNPRGLRAPDPTSQFSDLTVAVYPDLQSGNDPGVDESADGLSQYIVVHEPLHGHTSVCVRFRGEGEGDEGRDREDDCDDSPRAREFEAGETIPITVRLNPPNHFADIRLSFTDPNGTAHEATASGHSNIDNMFRRTGDSFVFNWSTRGLAPGPYTLTISPGPQFGALFGPQTIKVILER